MQNMIILKKIFKDYKLGTTVVSALKDINLEIKEGEFISICGPSGSGKTTLLNLIGCLDAPTSGNVFLSGQNVSELNDASLSKLRNNFIGFIFQAFNLVPVFNAYENVEYPLVIRGTPKKERQEKAQQADSAPPSSSAEPKPPELAESQIGANINFEG